MQVPFSRAALIRRWLAWRFLPFNVLACEDRKEMATGVWQGFKTLFRYEHKPAQVKIARFVKRFLVARPFSLQLVLSLSFLNWWNHHRAVYCTLSMSCRIITGSSLGRRGKHKGWRPLRYSSFRAVMPLGEMRKWDEGRKLNETKHPLKTLHCVEVQFKKLAVGDMYFSESVTEYLGCTWGFCNCFISRGFFSWT